MPNGTLNLTAIEQECLNHRLEIPDAIITALEEDDLNEDDLCDAIDLLRKGDFEAAFAVFPEESEAALIDAVNGSTWAASLYDSYDKTPAWRGAVKTGRSLAAKVSHYVGKVVMFPEK